MEIKINAPKVSTSFKTEKIYPKLENITITPTLEEQQFKSEKYGFENVIVEGIPATDIQVEPTLEEQVKEGLFNKVTVNAIKTDDLMITPTNEEQNFTGLYKDVTIQAVTADIDDDIKPENIRKGRNILGVDGGYEGIDTSDATATAEDVVAGKIVYANGKRVIGTVIDNGALEYTPSDEEQIIPAGKTSGGVVKATDITNLNEYNDCLELSEQLLTPPAVELPYKQVEYITATEGNGFDLGIPLWAYGYWDLQAEISISKLYNYQHIFSIDDDDTYHETWIDQTGTYYARLAQGMKISVGTFEVDKKTKIRHNWEKGDCTTYLDDEQTTVTSYGVFTSQLNLRFGKRGTSYFIGNIYSIKMYRGTNKILARDFIPVINKETGEATLYDLVTGTFATNLGSSSCIAGPEV